MLSAAVLRPSVQQDLGCTHTVAPAKQMPRSYLQLTLIVHVIELCLFHLVHHAVLGAKYKGFPPLFLYILGLKRGWLVILSNPPGNGSFLPSPSVGVNMQGGIGDPQILGYCAGNKRAMAHQ